jgi:RNA polymerase sigma factor (sigma-70 family)
MVEVVPLAGTAGEATALGGAHDFDEAYPALYRQAYHVAYRLLGSREDAADAAQEACARAFARWRQVSKHPSPMAWVARVSGNIAIDVHRRRATARRNPAADVEVRAGIDAERIDLHRALDALPRRQRQVVLLRYVADLSEATVAAELNCSLGNVKSLAARGLASLRTTMSTEG